MTTPAGDISLGDVKTEFGYTGDLNLGDGRIQAIVGHGLPISLGELRSRSSYPPVTASATNATQFAGGGQFGSTTVSTSSTCTAGGGSGGYTYAWSYVSGAGGPFTLTNGTSATASFSKLCIEASDYICTYQCVVTDNGGRTATATCTIRLVGRPGA